MEYFDSDYNTRRKMEMEYHNGYRRNLSTRDINSSGNKATMSDRVKMDTYFMNMANTAETCLRDDNCRRYLSNSMTDQAKKKSELKNKINMESSYNRYTGNANKPPAHNDVHYSRMYGTKNVAPNYKVDKNNDVAPNFRRGSQSVRGVDSERNKTQVTDEPSSTERKVGIVPPELKNLQIKGGANLSGSNPQIR